MSKVNKASDLSRRILEQIALEYVVNEKSDQEIIGKYNLTDKMLAAIVRYMDLKNKRVKYHQRVLDKSLERCATHQSKIILKATEILSQHIDQLSLRQRQQEGFMLSSSEVRDVMAILQIISKEHRLDTDQPTDRTIRQVQVMFPEGFRPITQKPDVIVNAEVKEVEEKSEEEIIVEVDEEILGSPLD